MWEIVNKTFTLVNCLDDSEIPLLKIFSTHFLRQFIMGSLTGAVASSRETEAYKGKFKLTIINFRA